MLSDSFPPWVTIDTRPELVCQGCGEREAMRTIEVQAAFALAHASCEPSRSYARVEAMLVDRVTRLARERIGYVRGSNADALVASEIDEINRALEALGVRTR